MVIMVFSHQAPFDTMHAIMGTGPGEHGRTPSIRTSWSSLKTRFHLMGVFAIVWKYFDARACRCASGSVARSFELEYFQSEFFSSRNYKSTKSHHSRRCIDTQVYAKAQKSCTADAAETRCERFLRRGETIDTRLIASLFLCQEICRAEDSNTN